MFRVVRDGKELATIEADEGAKNATYLVSNSGDWIESSVAKDGTWDGDSHVLASHFIEDGSTACDIGANMGTWVVEMARKHPSANFLAFEPQLQKFYQTCANILLNNLYNVVAHRYALTEEPSLSFKLMDLMINENGNNGASRLACEYEMTKGHMKPIRSEKVPLITLQFFSEALKNLSLLKVDVEGHELHVLRGAADLIAKHKPAIIFESWDFCVHKKPYLFQQLSAWGYKIYKIKTSEYLAVHEEKIKRYPVLEKFQRLN